jgi:hypothetical protein
VVKAGVLVVVLAAASVAVTTAAESATQPLLHVTGFAQIGTFHVRGGNPAAARAAFGRPARTVERTGRSCELSWPGLQLSFYTLVQQKQCGPDTPFGGATITRAWVTDRGLRQGDTVAKARKLYPAGSKRRPYFAGAHALGLIVRFSQAIGDYGLAAKIANGRVTTLVISDPQGGE